MLVGKHTIIDHSILKTSGIDPKKDQMGCANSELSTVHAHVRCCISKIGSDRTTKAPNQFHTSRILRVLRATMNKCFLLLLVAITLLVSGDALSDSQTEVTEVASAVTDNTIHTESDVKRALRGLESTEETSNEERGMSDLTTKFKSWAQNFNTWIAQSKLVKMATQQAQTLAQTKRVWKASRLIKKGSSDTVLYQNKVTPDEYFLAKGLNPKVKFIGESPTAWANNPGLEGWFTYSKFFESMQKKATP
ncbi:unnamed protein product [Phytophthora fragariaefolia]|uniref:RxLR effector protein n=1 Tax=Phytophthora fragariaefolia TaxID=1490495 RepID=A0A9W7D1H6_9STRA|nr:unnamed protein product [Phytophthora fragariaefolia]